MPPVIKFLNPLYTMSVNPDNSTTSSSTCTPPSRLHSQLSLASASRRRRWRNVTSNCFLDISLSSHYSSNSDFSARRVLKQYEKSLRREDEREHTDTQMRRRTAKSGGRARRKGQRRVHFTTSEID